MTRIGILALQGNYARHAAAFESLGLTAREVRHVAQLEPLDGLVIPGGESTTLLNLMRDEPWFDGIRRFHQGGGAIWGTCAGAILLAREVLDPPQPGLALLDAVIRRNAFGRQVDSFETEIETSCTTGRLTAVFIRAPRFVEVGADVEVLARLRGEPVLLRQGRILAATFHPELTQDRQLQRMFIDMTVEKPQLEHAGDRERRIPC